MSWFVRLESGEWVLLIKVGRILRLRLGVLA